MKQFKFLLTELTLVLGDTLAMALNFPNNPVERFAQAPTPGMEI